MFRNRKIVKILQRSFYVLYEKRPVKGRLKKPMFDEVSKCYRIQWLDMAYLIEGIVIDKMYISPFEYQQNNININDKSFALLLDFSYLYTMIIALRSVCHLLI